MFESVSSFVSAHLRYLPTIVLVWLAWFFGRTLRSGEMPLIERVARVGKPALSAALCRYTRGLTLLWTLWFVVAAAASLAMGLGFAQASVGIAAVAVSFFVGEHYLRRLFFPREWFPNLVQQVRDTVQVWRPSRPR